MNSTSITLRQLRAFRAVAETGSFTKAAENLYLTQSALSGLVKELEANLDLRLFDRTTRSLTLSTTGKHIYPMVNRVLYDIETMVTEVGRLKALENGVVKVAVSQQLAAAILPKVIASFANAYPNIHVSMVDSSVDGVIELVNSGEVDFGLGPARKLGDSIATELLFDLPFYVVVPPTHPFASQDSVRWCQLEHETLITLTGLFSELLAADLPDKDAHHIQNAAHRVNFMTTAFSMVNENLGVTFCLPYSRQRVSQNGLQMKLLTEPLVTRASYLYRQRGRTLSEAAHKFYMLLCQYLQKEQYV